MSTIVSYRAHAAVLLQHFGLAPFRRILTPADILGAALASGCAPKRRRVLVPETVVWLMLGVALHTSSMAQGLALAWGWLAASCGVARDCVSEEAFVQARQRLKLGFWRRLWRMLAGQYERRLGAQLLWKGVRLLAVDGTHLDLPNGPTVAAYFGRHRSQKGVSRAPQARLVALCSVLTGFCFDFVFTSPRFSEQLALRHLIRRLRAGDLVLLDRGFFSLCRDA